MFNGFPQLADVQLSFTKVFRIRNVQETTSSQCQMDVNGGKFRNAVCMLLNAFQSCVVCLRHFCLFTFCLRLSFLSIIKFCEMKLLNAVS